MRTNKSIRFGIKTSLCFLFFVGLAAPDRVALVAYQHFLSRGFGIPKDIGILGFDDMVGIGGLFLPPLSTVRLPHNDIGRAAALHIIRGRKTSSIYRIPCPFVGRASF